MKVYIVKSYTVVMYGWESWTIKKLSSEELMLSNCGAREDSWESLGQKDHQTRKATPKIHWKDWFWSWNFNTLATWCEELTHWKSPWCWERLRVGGEGDNWGWDSWMASPTQWTRVWTRSGRLKARKAWHAAVHGVARSWTWLSDWTTTTWNL